MEWIALAVLFVTLLLGFPVKESLLLSGLILWVHFLPGVTTTIFVQQMISSIDVYVLLAIPLFILAADIMTAGQVSERLLDFVQDLGGHIRGGLGMATAGAATLFGAVSGSSQATVAAIGPTMRKRSLQAGYSDTHFQALLVNTSGLAMLIPPSTVMIYYGTLTNTSVGDLFLAGVIPGLILFICFAAYEYLTARRTNVGTQPKPPIRQRIRSFRRAILALGLPVVILGSIYAGIATPTESAALAVVYAVILEMGVYRTVRVRDLHRIAASSAMTTGIIFILLAAGGAVSFIISYGRMPQALADTVLGSDPSRVRVLLIMSAFFIVACMFVDSLVAIAILAPIFTPITAAVGADPVYVGILITLQAAIGGVTPPFGVNIFTASAVFQTKYMTAVKGTLPYIAIFVLADLIFIFEPRVILAYEKVIPS